jgi:hemerythrin superfamily protein
MEEGRPMKATELLKKDHTAVKKLFAEFAKTTTRAQKKRQELIDKIATELDVHSQIEEEIFYPAVRQLAEGQRLVSEAEEEHQEVKNLVSEVQGMDPSEDGATAKVGELREAVLHHATEEEHEMFPVAERLGKEEIASLGEQMAERKQKLLQGAIPRMKRAVKKGARKVA